MLFRVSLGFLKVINSERDLSYEEIVALKIPEKASPAKLSRGKLSYAGN